MQYILVLVTCAIWGTVMYRAFLAWHGKVQYVPVTDENFTNYSATLAPDTFSLKLNYRDPFLDNVREEKPVQRNPIPLQNTAPKKVEQKMETWPNVSYEGMIRNQKNGKLLAMIHVNGKASMLSTGDIFEDVMLTRVYKDSVQVQYNRQKKYVRK